MLKIMGGLTAAVNDDLGLVKTLAETLEGDSHLYTRSFLHSMIERALYYMQ